MLRRGRGWRSPISFASGTALRSIRRRQGPRHQSDLAEAHCVKAHLLEEQGSARRQPPRRWTLRFRRFSAPEFWQVNREAARLGIPPRAELPMRSPFSKKPGPALLEFRLAQRQHANPVAIAQTGDAGVERGAAERAPTAEKAIAGDPSSATNNLRVGSGASDRLAKISGRKIAVPTPAPSGQ